jgi:hypothetical protein
VMAVTDCHERIVKQSNCEGREFFVFTKARYLRAPLFENPWMGFGKTGCNSLFRNILPITPLNSKIWRLTLAKLLILKDRGMGEGTPDISQVITI